MQTYFAVVGYQRFRSLRFAVNILWQSAICILAFSQLSFAQETPDEKLIRSVGDARAFIAEERPEKAIDIYESALVSLENSGHKFSSNAAFILNELAVLYRQSGDMSASQKVAVISVETAQRSGVDTKTQAIYIINLGHAIFEQADYSSALKVYQSAVRKAREATAANSALASALKSEAVAHIALGDPNAAVAALSQAVKAHEAADGTALDRNFILLELADAYLLRNDVTSARQALSKLGTLDAMPKATTVSIRMKRQLLEAKAAIREGRYDEGEKRLADLLSAKYAKRLSSEQRAAVHYNKAEILFMQGYYPEAEAENLRAEALFEQALGQNNFVLLQARLRRALIYQEVGDSETALEILGNVYIAAQRLLRADHSFILQVAVERARALARAGEFEQAIEKATLALPPPGNPLHNALDGQLARSALGLILYEAGEAERADGALQEAVDGWLSGQFGATHAPPALLALADLRLKMGDYSSAEKFAGSARDILLAMSAVSVDRLSESRRILAAVAMQKGQVNLALSLARQNVSILKQRLIAQSSEAGRVADFAPRAARAQIGQLMHFIWEQQKQDIELSRSQQSELFLAAQLVQQNETTRASAGLNRNLTGQGAEAFVKRGKILRRLRAYEKLLIGEADENNRASLRSGLLKLQAELDSVDALIERQEPALLDLLVPRLATIPELQATLKLGQAFWMQTTFKETSFLFLLTPTEFRLERVAIGSEDLRHRVESVRNTLDLRGRRQLVTFESETAHGLYRDFFRSFTQEIDTATELILVPDQALQQLSLATLVVGRKDGGLVELTTNYEDLRFLGLEIPLSIFPSADTLLRNVEVNQDRGRFGGFIGFGDPALTGNGTLGTRGLSQAVNRLTGLANPDVIRNAFEPLEESRVELERMAQALPGWNTQLFFGDQATETKIKTTNFKGIETLVFATHAVVSGDFENLFEPALIMTPPIRPTHGNDGLLKASEISELQLDASLIILSACNTGSASGRSGAPGLSGLVRAFYLAGARSMLVSHWTIASVSSVVLTPKFVELMANDTERSPSAALMIAMRTVATSERGSILSHPSIWAPFSVVGSL